MLTIPDSLSEELNAYSQVVRPVVTATFADNKDLENIKVSSSTYFWETAVMKKSPELYWRFNDFNVFSTSTFDQTNNGHTGVLNGTFFEAESPLERITKNLDLMTDTFTRADTTEGLGFVESNENITFEYNHEYAMFGIDSNEAYVSRVDNIDIFFELQPAYAIVDTGGRDGYVECEITTSGGIVNNQGLMCRYIDGDFIAWRWETGNNSKVVASIAGSVVDLDVNAATPIAAGDVIRLEFLYNTISVYQNGTPIHSFDIYEEVFESERATKHGLYLHAYELTARWDNLEIDTFNYLDRSLRFNGTDNYVSASELAGVSGFDGDFSIGFWANPDNVTGDKVAVCRSNSTGFFASNVQYRVWLDENIWKFTHSNGTTLVTASSSLAVVAGLWHFIFVKQEGTTISIYIDGVLRGTNTVSGTMPTFTSGTFAVGRDGNISSSYFEGMLDEVFVINDQALETFEVLTLYQSGINVGRFEGVEYFQPDEIINLIEEETFPWAVLDSFDEFGDTIISNGEYRALGNTPTINSGYGWWTRDKSDGSGDFALPEVTYVEFTARTANKIFFSTGYMYGRVNEFTYYYRIAEGGFTGVVLSETTTFPEGESILEIDIPEILIDMIGVKINSTYNPNDFGRIYETNVKFVRDISEDVKSFSVDKVRDNFEATLPIGNTAANNGDISVENSDRIYNPHGTSDIAEYILPDVKLDISLEWDYDSNDSGEVLQGQFYVDDWKISSSGMDANASFRDWSKYIQETVMTEGVIFENSIAGRAIADVMRGQGFPTRRIHFWDSYYNTILRDRPIAFWRLTDATIDAVDEMGNLDGEFQGVSYLRKIAAIMPQDNNPIIYPRQSGNSWDGDNTNTNQPTKQPVFITRFTGPSTYVEVDDSAGIGELPGDLTCEAVVKPTTLLTGDAGVIISKLNVGGDWNYQLHTFRSGSDFNYVFVITTNVGLFAVSSPNYTEAEFLGVARHVVGTRVGNTINLYIDGELVDTDTITGTNETPAESIAIGESLYPFFITDTNFVGDIGPVALYSRGLSASEIQNHYYTSQLTAMYVFKYLFSKDQSAWDAMLEFAAADVGMFYFDEDGDFRYEFKDTFHESVFVRHTESQYTLSDETNLIDGDSPVEIQTNKVVVTINKPILPSGFQEIWRAEAGESLAITTSTETLDASEVELNVTDLEEPLWNFSGIFKIADEIISYSSREGNTLLGLQRGLYGTTPQTHSSGAKVREVREYKIEYSDAPAVSVKYPFITAVIFDETVDIDRFTFDAYTANIIVSANENNAEGDLAVLEGKNPVTELENFFSIAGIPVSGKESSKNEQIVTEAQELFQNIRRFRTKELKIDNIFIQDKDYGRIISEFILRFFALPVPVLDVSVHGIPHLQLGDLVTIEKFDKMNIENIQYWVIENSLSYDGGIKQDLKLRRYSEGL